MNLPIPSRSPFDLHGRLCGVPLRIHPLFWCSAAALGIRYYADPEAGSLGYFGFWMSAALACVLLHALSQAFVARLFGMRGEIVLYGLGSLILGVDSARTWQRVMVLLAGPFFHFLLLSIIWGVTTLIPFPTILNDWGWQTSVATGIAILVRLNLSWGLLNILPIWPLSDGQVTLIVGEVFLGKKGRGLTLILSLGAIALLSVCVVFEMSQYLTYRYDPRYLLHLEEFIIQLFFCFLLWAGCFRALWPDGPTPADESTPKSRDQKR